MRPNEAPAQILSRFSLGANGLLAQKPRKRQLSATVSADTLGRYPLGQVRVIHSAIP